MSQDPVLFELEGRVAIARLNRPEIHNALVPEMVDRLLEIFGRVDRNPDTAVLIITGNGRSFSSGGNVRNMDAWNQELAEPANTRDWYHYGIQRLPRAFHALDVPVIAAVNGAAVGAGCDLTCMCDIRIAGRSARFSERFVKLGLIPGDGGAWFLPRAVGRSKAREMAFTGDFVDAEEALACGLVSQLVEDDALMTAAMRLAERIAVNPPRAVRYAKRLMREAEAMSLEGALQLSAAMQALAHTTSEHQDAVREFVNRGK